MRFSRFPFGSQSKKQLASSMQRRLRSALQRAAYRLTISDSYWRCACWAARVSVQDVEFRCENAALFIKPLQVTIRKREDHLCLLKGLASARKLAQHANASFTSDQDEGILIEFDGLRVLVKTAEELFILTEIYLEGIYNLVPGDSRSLLVLDVGMNVGLASLFFASRYPDALVVGFEPVADTFRMAQANFALNPEIAQRIQSHNQGLGAQTESTTFTYPAKYKGSAGAMGVQEQYKSERELKTEAVEIVKASETIGRLAAEHPDRQKIAKIDCEGAEFEILRDLDSADQLRQLDVVVMEWHHDLGGKPQELAALLQRHGFTTFLLQPQSAFGMIYSVRQDRT